MTIVNDDENTMKYSKILYIMSNTKLDAKL